MDVQADQAGLESDPYGTVASRPGTGQGRLFSESVDTVTSFADTDQLPAVPRDGYRSPGGSTRALRIAVIAVAVAVVAAAAALGLVKAGVIGSTTTSAPPNDDGSPSHRRGDPDQGPPRHPDGNGGGLGQLQRPGGGVRGHRHHDHGALLGQHRSRRPAPDLRRHLECRLVPARNPARAVRRRYRCGGDVGDHHLREALVHAQAPGGALQLPVHAQPLSGRTSSAPAGTRSRRSSGWTGPAVSPTPAE